MKLGTLKQNEAYSFPQNIIILGFLPILQVTDGPGSTVSGQSRMEFHELIDKTSS
jgi:hypothetical protein